MNERNRFVEAFGRPPDVVARAPGRVNLMGEHTDYNGGLVLPTPIPQHTVAELGLRPDREVRVRSLALEEQAVYRLGEEARGGDWLDYIKGVTWALGGEGIAVGGFDLLVSSEVPVGGGLSSSAALEVSALRALRAAFDLPLDDLRVALLSRRAEVELVGAPVGVMDQVVVSLGRQGFALLLDTRSLACEQVPLPPRLELLVIDSGSPHKHVSGGYRERRAECDRAAELLCVDVLCELDPADLDDVRLPPPLDRRVRHVVTENARVPVMADALRRADLELIARTMRASHRSMRDDFQVSTPQIDRLVALADADPHVHGARLTGGGFGGAIVALADAGQAAAAGRRIVGADEEEGAAKPRVIVPSADCSQASGGSLGGP